MRLTNTGKSRPTSQQIQGKTGLTSSNSANSHSLDCRCPDCLGTRVELAFETVCFLLTKIHKMRGLDVDVTHVDWPDVSANGEIFNYSFSRCGHTTWVQVPMDDVPENLSPLIYANCPACWQQLEEEYPIDSLLFRALDAAGSGKFKKTAQNLARLINIIRHNLSIAERTITHEGTLWLESSIEELREDTHWLLSESAIFVALWHGELLGIILTQRSVQKRTLYRLQYDRIDSLRESVSDA